MKLPREMKRIIRKDSLSPIGYVYRDGIVLWWTDRFERAGQKFSMGRIVIAEGEIPIIVHTKDPFFKDLTPRFIFHRPSMLLDGVKQIVLYWNNTNENMQTRGLYEHLLLLTTEGIGMEIEFNIYPPIRPCIEILWEGLTSVKEWQERYETEIRVESN